MNLKQKTLFFGLASYLFGWVLLITNGISSLEVFGFSCCFAGVFSLATTIAVRLKLDKQIQIYGYMKDGKLLKQSNSKDYIKGYSDALGEEYDTRLSVGNPVDIKFHEIDGNRYIHKVIPRKEYEYKCS